MPMPLSFLLFDEEQRELPCDQSQICCAVMKAEWDLGEMRVPLFLFFSYFFATITLLALIIKLYYKTNNSAIIPLYFKFTIFSCVILFMEVVITSFPWSAVQDVSLQKFFFYYFRVDHRLIFNWISSNTQIHSRLNVEKYLQ